MQWSLFVYPVYHRIFAQRTKGSYARPPQRDWTKKVRKDGHGQLISCLEAPVGWHAPIAEDLLRSGSFQNNNRAEAVDPELDTTKMKDETR